MSSCDRRRMLAGLGSIVTLAGCGFRPLHGSAGPAGGLEGNVAVLGADGRLGYHFRQAMRQRVGTPAAAPRYALTVELAFAETELAVTERDDATRFNVGGTARYRLIEPARAAEIAAGEAQSVSAYNTLSTPFSTRVAQQAAERRVAEDLARRVFFQMTAALGGDAVAG